MKHALTCFLIATGMAVITAPATAAQGNPELGASLASQGDGSGVPCVVCHGADGMGNDAGGFPRLAGLDAGYLAKQMQDYKAGRRISAIMQPNVDNFSDQQISDIAAYFAGLPTAGVQAPANIAGDLLASGEKLVKEGDWNNHIPPCSSCHGPDSQGVGSSFPALAGQHPGYIRQQLTAWKKGERDNDPNQLMTAVAERLSDAQITAVAAYLGSLSPDNQ